MTIDMCAFCGAKDFKKCGCPWDKHFEAWPKPMLEKLRSMLPSEPHPGS